VNLVGWPISLVKVLKSGEFLGDLVEDDKDEEEAPNQFIQVIQQSKRTYQSVKRLRMDPKEKEERERQKKLRCT
jgi:hypothetical protein